MQAAAPSASSWTSSTPASPHPGLCTFPPPSGLKGQGRTPGGGWDGRVSAPPGHPGRNAGGESGDLPEGLTRAPARRALVFLTCPPPMPHPLPPRLQALASLPVLPPGPRTPEPSGRRSRRVVIFHQRLCPASVLRVGYANTLVTPGRKSADAQGLQIPSQASKTYPSRTIKELERTKVSCPV